MAKWFFIFLFTVLLFSGHSAWGEELPCETPVSFGKEVKIKLTEYQFQPNCIEVRKGNIRFILKNEGKYGHDLRIEGEGVEKRSPKVKPMQTKVFETRLAPGRYKIWCRIGNHAKRGMVGTLLVQPLQQINE